MSEAELHVLRARLRGGILSKAKRGELRGPLPIGFVYGANDKVILDPDAQVQQVIRLFFDTYRRSGSMLATVKEFHTQDLAFPRRVKRGPRLGELVWGELVHSRARQMIHNPRYAGAFFFGRTRTRRGPDGQTRVVRVPRDQWILLPDVHAGYITWAEYEENLRRLHVNAQARGPDRRRSPPRDGPTLLQGLAICGHCGERMTVRYHCYHAKPVPDYWCGRRRINHGEPGICQTIHGGALDEAIGDRLVEAMTPLAVDVALTVQQELAVRAAEADRVRQQHLERARYEADLAQRRFLRVEPENRLVADALEAEWNDRLRALAAAQDAYAQARETDARVVTDEQRAEIFALATDFPRLWRDPATSAREKKRMMRLLIADVTLRKGKTIHADIRFTGGATRSVEIPLPKTCIELRTTDAAIVKEIDTLLDTYTDAEIADLLNERGVRTATMQPFTRITVIRLRTAYGLTSRRTRLLKAGLLTPHDVARRYGLRLSTVHQWRRRGLLRAHPVNDKGEYLYELPSDDLPAKSAWKRAYRVAPRTTSRDTRGAV